jgi:GWxTD domain-containing protein
MSRLPCAFASAMAVALALGCAGAPPPPVEELTNIRLGPEYSQWLVGPIVRMSTREEVEQYQALTDDAAAQAFIEAYWQRRGPAFRRLFETRAAEADTRFSEAGFSGRRTDRGTIYVLHGAAKDVRFETPQFVGEPTLEVWTYDTADLGLGGKPPSGEYRFAKIGDLTVFYQRRMRHEIDAIP